MTWMWDRMLAVAAVVAAAGAIQINRFSDRKLGWLKLPFQVLSREKAAAKPDFH